MAQSRVKAGGPTRGRLRVRRIGMGSGKHIVSRKHANTKKKTR